MARQSPVDVRWLEPRVLEIVCRGQLLPGHVELLIARVRLLTMRERPRACFVVTDDVTGVDPNLPVQARRAITFLLGLGCKRAVIVASSPLVRMMGSALAIGAGDDALQFCESRDEGLRLLHSSSSTSSNSPPPASTGAT